MMFKKSYAIIRYVFVYLVLFPAQLLALLFPLAWVLRWMGKFNPLWIVLDDSRVGAEDYRIWLSNYKFKPLGVLLWHVKRNRVWNLVEFFKVKNGNPETGNQNIEVVEYVRNGLYKNNKDLTHVEQDGIYVASAGLKYIPKNEDDNIWQVNSGDIINRLTSILGTGFIWYKAGNWFSFRYSQCRIVNYGIWKGYRTLRFGTNSKRYTFTIKHQKDKTWQ